MKLAEIKQNGKRINELACYMDKLKKSCYRSARRFNLALKDVSLAQETCLKNIIKKNAYTVFGEKYNFKHIDNVKKYQYTVPISSYEDYQEYIEQIALGKSKILTQERVLLLEPTSGSIATRKNIPYTSSLFSEFRKGIMPWLYNIFSEKPNLANGSFYWSVTPAAYQYQRSQGGIPIGFGDDMAYFSRAQQALLSPLLAVPFSVSQIENIEKFQIETLRYLLNDKKLSFISIWSPTFLTVLLDFFVKNAEQILAAISDELRQEELTTLFLNYQHDLPTMYQKIWPNLALISCWADGGSAGYINLLKKIFPNVKIQGKGLIATEAFVSFPLLDHAGSILAIQSHFFEFKHIMTEIINLAHELEFGKQYEVIVTTSGGLYRYQMGDIIEVVGFKGQCPLIKFIGRNNVIDYCGEKLNEFQLNEILASGMQELSIIPNFLLFAPDKYATNFPLNYIIFMESEQSNVDSFKKLVDFVEHQLNKNYHYQYCRQLAQLGPVKGFKITGGEKPASQVYVNTCLESGMKMGNVKCAFVSKETGWLTKFSGFFI